MPIFKTLLTGRAIQRFVPVLALASAGFVIELSPLAQENTQTDIVIGQEFEGPVANAEELGRIVFERCQACHQVGNGPDSVGTQYGPQLNGILGRRAGSLTTYKYSLALDQANFFWTFDKLTRYIAKPRREVVGTSMAYAGIKNQNDVANLIAYLAQFEALSQAAPRPRLRPANL